MGRRCIRFSTRKVAQRWSFSTRIAIQICSFPCKCVDLVNLTEENKVVYIVSIFFFHNTIMFCILQAGPRICLGKDFAYRQMKIVSIALLSFFRFKLAREDKSLTYKSMLTLHIDQGLFIYAHPRTP